MGQGKPQFVLQGSFGGSSEVIVGVFDDWEKMLDVVNEGRDEDGELLDDVDERFDEPERISVTMLPSAGMIDRNELESVKLWDSKEAPPWNTKGGVRPSSIADLLTWQQMSRAMAQGDR